MTEESTWDRLELWYRDGRTRRVELESTLGTILLESWTFKFIFQDDSNERASGQIWCVAGNGTHPNIWVLALGRDVVPSATLAFR